MLTFDALINSITGSISGATTVEAGTTNRPVTYYYNLQHPLVVSLSSGQQSPNVIYLTLWDPNYFQSNTHLTIHRNTWNQYAIVHATCCGFGNHFSKYYQVTINGPVKLPHNFNQPDFNIHQEDTSLRIDSSKPPISDVEFDNLLGERVSLDESTIHQLMDNLVTVFSQYVVNVMFSGGR